MVCLLLYFACELTPATITIGKMIHQFQDKEYKIRNKFVIQMIFLTQCIILSVHE